jgi:hypothetical protein
VVLPARLLKSVVAVAAVAGAGPLEDGSSGIENKSLPPQRSFCSRLLRSTSSPPPPPWPPMVLRPLGPAAAVAAAFAA